MSTAAEYKLSPEMPLKRARQLSVQTVLLMVCGLGAGIYGASKQHTMTPAGLGIAAAVLIPIIAVTMYLALRQQRKAWQTFRLIVTPDSLTRRVQGLPDLVVHRGEITRIHRVPGYGINVCTADRQRQLFISDRLQGFEEVLDDLASWVPLEEKPLTRSAQWLPLLVGVAAVLLVTLAMRADSPSVVRSTNLVVAVGLSACVYYLWRSPHLERWRKLCMLLLIPTILSFLVRAVAVP